MSINNYYQLYIDDTYRLAETMVIKFKDAAAAINNLVILKHGIESVNVYDPTTWKYYQNMCGRYHFYDTEMIITSLDTLEEIVFNQANLLIHQATRKAYEFDTRYYRDLVNRFPEQEALILGILYSDGTDELRDLAIAAKDGTILYYPKHLTEFNEYNLISKLQTFINNYVDRWINIQFSISDDLYPATYMAQLYLHLIPTLINLRLSNCKTNEAHSFHIRQYLASHGMLDRYLDVLTKEQALFFYRNILYIQRNAGKRDTFDWLVENIMTKRGLPLYEYTMKHDTSHMLPNEYYPEQLSYVPEIFFKRKTINYLNTDTEVFTYNLDQVLSKIAPLTKGNIDYHTYHTADLIPRLEDSLSNTVYTKLLESTLDDYSDAVPYTLESILLNHWMYWSFNDTYLAKITLTLPKTKRSLVMSSKDSFILYLYALNRAVGITPVNVPDCLAIRVLRPVLPTLAELKGKTEATFVTEAKLTEIIDSSVESTELISINAFYDKAKAIYDSTLIQYKLQCVSENDHEASQIELATMLLYQDVKCTFSSVNLSYEDWLFNYTLDFEEYTNSDFMELALNIYYDATNASINESISVKRIQRSMIEILKLLSSYSIEIISDVNNTGITLVPGRDVKALKITSGEKSQEYNELPIFETKYVASYSQDGIQYDLEKLDLSNMASKEYSKNEVSFITEVMKYKDDPRIAPEETELPIFTVLNNSSFYENFNALTNTQKREILSIY